MEKEEKEQLIDVIKTNGYYLTIIISIILGIGMIIWASTMNKVYGLALIIAFLGCIYLIISNQLSLKSDGLLIIEVAQLKKQHFWI